MREKLPLTFREIQELTGIGRPCFRKYIQDGLLPPAMWHVGASGRKNGGAQGVYHPDTIAWIEEIKAVAGAKEKTLRDARSDLRQLAWLEAVAEKMLGSDAAKAAFADAVRKASAALKKGTGKCRA